MEDEVDDRRRAADSPDHVLHLKLHSGFQTLHFSLLTSLTHCFNTTLQVLVPLSPSLCTYTYHPIFRHHTFRELEGHDSPAADNILISFQETFMRRHTGPRFPI